MFNITTVIHLLLLYKHFGMEHLKFKRNFNPNYNFNFYALTVTLLTTYRSFATRVAKLRILHF